MLAAGWAVVGAGCTAYGPAMIAALRRRRPNGEAIVLLALSPVLVMGTLWLSARIGGVLGIPLGAATQLPAWLGLTALLRWFASPVRERGEVLPDDGLPVVHLVILSIAVIVGLGVWTAALSGQPSTPPSRDGEYHGYFVASIVDTRSVAVEDVVTTDPVTREPAAAYYPLALHNAAASQVIVLGGDVDRVLQAWTLLAASLGLPLSLFAFVRWLAPDVPLAAPIAAAVAPLVAMFPYQPVTWSALPLVVGLAAVPAVLAGIGRLVVDPRRTWVPLVALCVLGLFECHTSQAALLAVWSAVLVPTWVVRRSRGSRASIVRRITASASIAAVFSLPSLMLLASASAERSPFQERPWMSLATASRSVASLGFALPDPQYVMSLLALAGAVIAALHRTTRGWLACSGVALLLFLGAAVTDPPASWFRGLTGVWYSSPWRTSYNVALCAIVLAGLGGGAAAAWVGRRLYGRRWPAAVVGCGALLVAPWYTALPHRIVESAYAANAPATDEFERALEALASAAGSDDTVLNEERDGSGWMYASRGLRPLHVVYAYEQSPTTRDRTYLLENIAAIEQDPRVRALIERWNVRYVFVDDVGFIDEPPRWSIDDFSNQPAFRQVFREGPIAVFEIELSPHPEEHAE